jgi:uncharacterized protein
MKSATDESLMPEIIRRLTAALDPIAIYHFGSSAEGRAGPDSDIDLLVIVEDSPLDFIDRSVLGYRALRGIGVAVDVQVYTRAEFESRSSLPVSFERTVRNEGRLVYAA